ncbi:hypothetical protein SLEP1_g12164 [Rubroshorea leprosula]|nr:hypothetical protein SLEP1_g12164 [Rubroshorea leprosula]
MPPTAGETQGEDGGSASVSQRIIKIGKIPDYGDKKALLSRKRITSELNLLYSAAKVYLPIKISPASLARVNMRKIRSQKNITVALPVEEEIVDTFNNVKVTWRYVCTQQTEQNRTYNGDNGFFSYSSEKRYLELYLYSEHTEEVASAYLQHVMSTAAYWSKKKSGFVGSSEVKTQTEEGPLVWCNYIWRRLWELE